MYRERHKKEFSAKKKEKLIEHHSIQTETNENVAFDFRRNSCISAAHVTWSKDQSKVTQH